MFPFNEYQVHEHHKELLRSAEQARLAKETLVERLLFEQFGWLLAWGARFAVSESGECQTAENSIGQIVTVCPV